MQFRSTVSSNTGFARLLMRLSGIAACLALALALSPASASAQTGPLTTASQQTATLQAQSVKRGWVETNAGRKYYRNGKPLKGLYLIGEAYYCFDDKGLLRTKDFKSGGVRFYVAADGQIIGAKHGSTYYYETLKPMATSDVLSFQTYLQARTLLASIVDKGDTRATKRRKAFDWVVEQEYVTFHWLNGGSDQADWPAYTAKKVFDGEGGDCHGASAAYAYLLAAIGDAPLLYVDVERNETTHAWVEFRGRRFDPVYAKWQGYEHYYNAKGRGNYDADGNWIAYKPTTSYKIPSYDPNNAGKKAKVPKSLFTACKAGLKTKESKPVYYENGSLVKNAWRTIDGKRYYFTATGDAATGSVKIKGVYYVFNEKGELLRSTQKGLRTVKVAGNVYRVDKAGRAARGWSADKRSYYGASGKMLKRAWAKISKKSYYFKSNGLKATGPTKIGNAYYVFNAKGVLQKGASDTGSLVTVGSQTYRIDKTGKAVPGWSSSKKHRFAADGRLLKGICVIDDAFYAADADGRYLSRLTAQLSAASEPAHAPQICGSCSANRFPKSTRRAAISMAMTVFGNTRAFSVLTARPTASATQTGFESVVTIAAK